MISRNEMFAIGFVMPIIGGVAVYLRFLSARKQSRIGTDNWCIVFGYAVLLGCSVVTLVGTFIHGFGREQNTGTSEGGLKDDSQLLRTTKKFAFTIDNLIDFALMGCKLALLFFYRRIFRGRTFNIITIVTSVLVVAWATAMFLLGLLQCGKRIQLMWRSAEIVKENCLPGAPISLWNASFDVLMDLVIIGIPLYYVQHLFLSRGQKILVTFLFAFGGLAIVASVLRLVAYTGIFPKHNEAPDQIQYLTKIVFYCLLEAGLAVIAACLPTYGTLLSTRQKRRLQSFLDRNLPTLHLTKSPTAGVGSGKVTLPPWGRSQGWHSSQQSLNSRPWQGSRRNLARDSPDVSIQGPQWQDFRTSPSSVTGKASSEMQERKQSVSSPLGAMVSPRPPPKAMLYDDTR